MIKETEMPQNIKNNDGLIVYQIGELKALFLAANLKWDQWQSDMDKRIKALEEWRAAQAAVSSVSSEKTANGNIDVTKIVLGAFGVIASAIALALAAIQTGVVK